MKAAAWPRALEAHRMLVIDRSREALAIEPIDQLAAHARPGDVWVLNDAGTLPASLAGRLGERACELRLAGHLGGSRFAAVLFGEGSWRDDTDRRPLPPRVEVGSIIALGGSLAATVTSISVLSPRLIEVALSPEGDRFWSLLYRLGRPVQYSYLAGELSLAQVQTPYASRPWAVEAPSAGRPITPRTIASVRARGAEIATLTHAAGLSATGDPHLDAQLPLRERYAIPAPTARAIERARRVVAVGTSVARALEGAMATHGEVRPGEGETDLRLGPSHRPRVVGALMTGAHDPTSSHYELLRAFASEPLLSQAVLRSTEAGLLGHELGDSWLLV